jgi:hypothetical protein
MHQSMVWLGINAASGVPLLWSSLTMSEGLGVSGEYPC